jgi:hypothetical protein
LRFLEVPPEDFNSRAVHLEGGACCYVTQLWEALEVLIPIDYLEGTINEYQHALFSVVPQRVLVTSDIVLISSYSIPKYTS